MVDTRQQATARCQANLPTLAAPHVPHRFVREQFNSNRMYRPSVTQSSEKLCLGLYAIHRQSRIEVLCRIPKSVHDDSAALP